MNNGSWLSQRNPLYYSAQSANSNFRVTSVCSYLNNEKTIALEVYKPLHVIVWRPYPWPKILKLFASTESAFHLSVDSISHLLWFCITTLSDWFKNLAPLSQPTTSKTKPNRDSLTDVFPRSALATCICLEFWLVLWIVCVLCDWPEWLLWFWFYDTQAKITVNRTRRFSICWIPMSANYTSWTYIITLRLTVDWHFFVTF